MSALEQINRVDFMKKYQQNMLIFTGMPGSGKGEASRVARGMGYKVFSHGDVIREETKKRGLALTPENIRKVSLWFSIGREGKIVNSIIHQIKKTKTTKKFIVIDGAKDPEHLKIYKKHGFNYKIVFITLPTKIRYARQLSRHRSDISSVKDSIARDKKEYKFGIRKVFKYASKRISNNCTKRKFDSKIKKLLSFYDRNGF